MRTQKKMSNMVTVSKLTRYSLAILQSIVKHETRNLSSHDIA